MNTSRTLIALTLLATLGPLGAHAAPDESALTVRQHWNVGGEGGWDYLTLDPTGRRLFVSRSTHVDVIDTATGRITATIPNTEGVHGIALAQGLNRGYTSNGRADSVTVFDLGTLRTIKEVKIDAQNPDAILYEPRGKHVFTFNGKSKNVTVIDAVGLTPVATLPVPGKPEFAVDDGAGRIFVNIESESGQMVVIDSRSLAVEATWNLPGCRSPTGLAIDRVHHRLFSVCDDHVMAVTDAVTGKQAAQVKIGEGPDAAAYDPKRNLVFSSNGDGTLTVIHQTAPDHYDVIDTLATMKGGRTMALDSLSGRLYIASAKFGATPSANAAQPHPRPAILAGSFTILVVGAKSAALPR